MKSEIHFCRIQFPPFPTPHFHVGVEATAVLERPPPCQPCWSHHGGLVALHPVALGVPNPLFALMLRSNHTQPTPWTYRWTQVWGGHSQEPSLPWESRTSGPFCWVSGAWPSFRLLLLLSLAFINAPADISPICLHYKKPCLHCKTAGGLKR